MPATTSCARARLSCRVCISSHTDHIQRALAARPHSMGPAVQAIHDDERDTGSTWQQRGPLAVAWAA